MKRVIKSKRNLMWKLLLTLFIVGVFGTRRNVYAQQISGFSVSPPTFEISANPGDTIENTVRIENISDFDIEIALDKKDFLAIGDEGAVELLDDTGTFSLSSWIEFTETGRTIAAKKSALIPFRIKIPANAEPGGHFASVLFRTVPTGTLDQSGSTLSQEIGALILLRIAGQTTELATIQEFTTSKFSEYGPIEFDLNVKNDGNVHVKPVGGVTVTNVWGKKVANIDVVPKNVLPGANRKSQTTWDTKYLFGPYTATASLVYGTENKLLTSSTSFFVLPYKIVIVALAILLIISYVLYKGRRRLITAARVLFSGN